VGGLENLCTQFPALISYDHSDTIRGLRCNKDPVRFKLPPAPRYPQGGFSYSHILTPRDCDEIAKISGARLSLDKAQRTLDITGSKRQVAHARRLVVQKTKTVAPIDSFREAEFWLPPKHAGTRDELLYVLTICVGIDSSVYL
jgi:hypothetical protein